MSNITRHIQCSCLAISIVVNWSVLLVDEIVAGDVWPPTEANCVDDCITEFAQLMHKRLSRSELAQAIAQAGLEEAAFYRNLAECKLILDSLDIPNRAVQVTIDAQLDFPPVGIVYLPAGSPHSPGHVVVVSTEDGNLLRVFDPASKPKVLTVAKSDLRAPLHTIAIIPAPYALNRAAVKTMRHLTLCVLFGAALAAVGLGFRSFVSRRVRAGSLLCVVLVVGILAGCNRDDVREETLVVEPRFDFGILDATTVSDEVSHDFSIKNPNDIAIEILSVSSSCRCTVIGANLEQINIQPKEKVVLPVSVDIRRKLGPFREYVILKYRAAQIAEQLVVLEGFIMRPPFARENPLRLRATGLESCTRELEVACVRRGNDQEAIPTDYFIEYDHKATSSGTRDCPFSVGLPHKEARKAGEGGMCDVWCFPIVYQPSAQINLNSARFFIHWNGSDQNTCVDLVGELLPPIELRSKRVILPKLAAGVEYVEEIPIRINDLKTAERVVVHSNNRGINGTLDSLTSRLRLSVVVEHQGMFNGDIEFMLDNIGILRMEIAGYAN